MITIYTTNSCSSCKKAIKWFREHNIKFTEKNMFTSPITRDDIRKMLENTENGFEDIISTRSKIILENKIDIESMKFSELENFIISNPSVLKRPIIVDDFNFQAGYDDDEITVFKPRELRSQFQCDRCMGDNDCEYTQLLRDSLTLKKQL